MMIKSPKLSFRFRFVQIKNIIEKVNKTIKYENIDKNVRYTLLMYNKYKQGRKENYS